MNPQGRSMASEAQQKRSDQILEFLVSKDLHGCPICAQGQFSVGPEHVIISIPIQTQQRAPRLRARRWRP
jgi:hypothetical protein